MLKTQLDMKRPFSEDLMSGEEEPPIKKQKRGGRFYDNIISLLEDRNTSDITFRVPGDQTNAVQSKSDIDCKSLDADNEESEDIDIDIDIIDKKTNIKEESEDDIDENVNYKEYKCHKAYFIAHSSVIKTMTCENVKNGDGNTTITLDGISTETFEFIRNYCYGLVIEYNNNNIFDILIGSDKYGIDSLIYDCINYIKNKWIINKHSLFEFLENVSNYQNKCNNNAILKYIGIVLKDNKLLQRYACELASSECDHHPDMLHVTILMELLKSNSLYINEDLVWKLCYNNALRELSNGETKLDLSVLQKLVPYIKFDIIGIGHFINEIEPTLLEFNLKNKSELYDIYHSWHVEELYKEKFTLLKQRFDFKTNYLDFDKDIIKDGDWVSYMIKKDVDQWFYHGKVQKIDRNSRKMEISNEDNTIDVAFDDIIMVKYLSIGDTDITTNNRLYARSRSLDKGKQIQYRTIVDVMNNPDAPWKNGSVKQKYEHNFGGQIQIIDQASGFTYIVPVNDDRLIRCHIQ